MTTETLIALFHCAAVVVGAREVVAARTPQRQSEPTSLTGSPTDFAGSTLSCQKTCEAAGHCSIGVGSGCDRQPTCSMGCAIAAVPGVTLSQCIAECNAVSGTVQKAVRVSFSLVCLCDRLLFIVYCSIIAFVRHMWTQHESCATPQQEKIPLVVLYYTYRLSPTRPHSCSNDYTIHTVTLIVDCTWCIVLSTLAFQIGKPPVCSAKFHNLTFEMCGPCAHVRAPPLCSHIAYCSKPCDFTTFPSNFTSGNPFFHIMVVSRSKRFTAS